MEFASKACEKKGKGPTMKEERPQGASYQSWGVPKGSLYSAECASAVFRELSEHYAILAVI